jgi:hypothetical protein
MTHNRIILGFPTKNGTKSKQETSPKEHQVPPLPAIPQQASFANARSKTQKQKDSKLDILACPLYSPMTNSAQRRREQNRTSQKKFREKMRKTYEAVLQALETERQTSARLRDEVTALHSAIDCLTKGSQSCLETISRLYQSGNKNGQTVLEVIAAFDDA